MRHAPDTNSSSIRLTAGRMAVLSVLLFASTGSVFAQSSSLPPTNMGKFVHQPGDNQYSNSTQAERHAPPPVVQRQVSPTVITTTAYMRTPPPRRADPTLEAIAADEPIVQAGFPPMPDRADLPGSGSGWSPSSGAGGGRNVAAAPGAGGVMKQGYRQVPAGAYIPQEQGSSAPSGYKCKTPASDSYAANPSSGSGSSHLGKEPSLNPRLDAGVVAEAPAPVVVKQATTQDLSLPDDQFSNASQPKPPSQTGMMFKQMGRQMMMQPLMQVSGMSGGMLGRIHF